VLLVPVSKVPFSFVVMILGYTEVAATGEQDDEEGSSVRNWSYHHLLLLCWLCWICCIWHFGSNNPGNILTAAGLGPFWLVDIANMYLILHLIGAYQVSTQQLLP
jgi:hypothetical protein